MYRIFLAFPLMLLSSAAAPAPGYGGFAGVQVTIHQRLIIRIPRVADRHAAVRRYAPPPSVHWREKKAGRCFRADGFAGARVSQRDSVDLIQRGGRRLRAELGPDCPALDFYSGLYLKPGKDHMICAGRDSIRSRSGSQCRIEGFKRLVAGR